jgi:hypothetical protein
MTALADRKPEAPPLPASDLARLGGGDAFLIFFESYGALVFDEHHYRDTLAAPYAELSATLARDGWHSISAFVDSPTFGGGSWLAHSTMLYGVQTTRHGDYGRLLKSHRDNLADRFRTAGYRTVALMPGIQQDWPEGAALGVDAIHDAAGLAYAGTSFGWWRIPDQFSLNWLGRHELAPSPREPLFVFYPTITSHFPFSPVPPYVADWDSLDGPQPYGDLVPTTHGEQADPVQMKQNYLDTIGYDLRLLAGFLDQRVRPGSLLIVLGDHQPPAIVSGKGASVSVPVHVFATDERLLEPFLASGFVPGLVPSRPAIGPMAKLPHLLLEALDGKAAPPMARALPPVSP